MGKQGRDYFFQSLWSFTVVADIIDIIANRNTEAKPIVWETAKECDIADFADYACRRVFITNKATDIVSGAVKESDGIFGTMTEIMTEAEVTDVVRALGDDLISVYRVL